MQASRHGVVLSAPGGLAGQPDRLRFRTTARADVRVSSVRQLPVFTCWWARERGRRSSVGPGAHGRGPRLHL